VVVEPVAVNDPEAFIPCFDATAERTAADSRERGARARPCPV